MSSTRQESHRRVDVGRPRPMVCMGHSVLCVSIRSVAMAASVAGWSACEVWPRPAAPPPAPASSPRLDQAPASSPRLDPAPASSPPLDHAPASSPRLDLAPAAVACELDDPGSFPCAHARVCPTVDRSDAQIEMREFLCIAQSHVASGAGTPSLAAVLAELPVSFRKNFTAKHGLPHAGVRGHAFEELETFVDPEIAAHGQSADPEFPRVIMWDELTGFTISMNGGAPGQHGGDRLDLMGFDVSTQSFTLWALDLPLPERGVLAPFQPHTSQDDCAFCHGPFGRPIWPMYPDWPGFFGSDNDDLTAETTHQRTERALLNHFRRCIAAPPAAGPSEDCASVPAVLAETSRPAAAAVLAETSRPAVPAALAEASRPAVAAVLAETSRPAAPAVDTRRRFSTLFAAALEDDLRRAWPTMTGEDIAAWAAANPSRLSPGSRSLNLAHATTLADFLGLHLHETFPYRPDHRHESGEPSRAFFHRPNLRLGVLYQRLLVRAVFARLRRDPIFVAHAALVAHTLMDCGWDGPKDAYRRQLRRLRDDAADRLASADQSIVPRDRLLTPVLFTALGLRLRDLDMRFSQPHPHYDPFERAYPQASLVDNPMELGYVAYRDRDHNAVNGSKSYFNAYFDGSATFDELLVAKILEQLATEDPSLRAALEPHSLARKYAHSKARWALDQTFFARMDALGTWIPLPYPRHLRRLHDREPFGKVVDGRAIFIEPYRATCAALQARLE